MRRPPDPTLTPSSVKKKGVSEQIISKIISKKNKIDQIQYGEVSFIIQNEILVTTKYDETDKS